MSITADGIAHIFTIRHIERANIMTFYTVLAVKQMLLETNIEASSKEDAWQKAQALNENQFTDLEHEKAWKIKWTYGTGSRPRTQSTSRR